MNINGKTIVLTGATGGIGQAFARMLDHEGARLVLVGRKTAELQKLSDTLDQWHHLVEADINTAEGREKIANTCRAIGHIDMLVNNAGISEFAAFETQQPRAIAHMLQTNLLSPILLTQELLPLLRAAGSGMIINIGSTFGSIGYPGFSAYSASKFGMRGFTEALRRELAGSGIQVRYLAPRATRTAINSEAVNALNAALGNAMDDPAVVALALKDLIMKNSYSSYLGWPEKLFVRINSLLPKLVDNALFKQLPTIQAFLGKHV